MKRVFETARPAQRDLIEAMLREAFTPYAEKAGFELTDSDYDWLPAWLEEGLVYVGLEGETLIGVISTTRKLHEWKIDYVASVPDRQGMGIGSWLMSQLEETACGQGVRTLTLHTAEVRQDLIGFYKSHGFEEYRRELPAHGKDAHMRVHMRKEI